MTPRTRLWWGPPPPSSRRASQAGQREYHGSVRPRGPSVKVPSRSSDHLRHPLSVYPSPLSGARCSPEPYAPTLPSWTENGLSNVSYRLGLSGRESPDVLPSTRLSVLTCSTIPERTPTRVTSPAVFGDSLNREYDVDELYVYTRTDGNMCLSVLGSTSPD